MSCGQGTYDPDALCRECRQLIRDGQAFHDLKGLLQPGDLEQAPTTNRWLTYHFAGEITDRSKEQYRFQEAVMALAGARSEYYYNRPVAWDKLSDAPLGPDLKKVGQPRGKSTSGFDEPFVMVAPAGKIALVQEAYEAAVNLMAISHREGVREGEHLLNKLIDGQLTMADTYDRAAREEG